MEAGMVQPTKVPEMADAVDFATMYNEGAPGTYSEEEIGYYRDGTDPDLYPNVNWLKSVFRKHTFNQRVTANVSGGGEIARYFISAGYYHEDGLFETGKREILIMVIRIINVITSVRMWILTCILRQYYH